MQKIPQSLYDAARVDGAGPVREFFAVTLPALRGEIAVALTLTTIQALRNFDLVYITTGGGPGRRDVGARLPGLQPRVRDAARSARPSAIGICTRGDHLRDHAAASTGSPSGGGAMIDRREQALTYALLGVFSLIALRADRRHRLHRAAGPGGGRDASAAFDGLHFGNFTTAWERRALRART